MRGLEILTKTAYHHNSSYSLFSHFAIQIEIVIIVKFKIHPRSHKRIRCSFFPQVAIKSLSAIQLLSQIKYFSLLI